MPNAGLMLGDPRAATQADSGRRKRDASSLAPSRRLVKMTIKERLPHVHVLFMSLAMISSSFRDGAATVAVVFRWGLGIGRSEAWALRSWCCCVSVFCQCPLGVGSV